VVSLRLASMGFPSMQGIDDGGAAKLSTKLVYGIVEMDDF